MKKKKKHGASRKRRTSSADSPVRPGTAREGPEVSPSLPPDQPAFKPGDRVRSTLSGASSALLGLDGAGTVERVYLDYGIERVEVRLDSKYRYFPDVRNIEHLPKLPPIPKEPTWDAFDQMMRKIKFDPFPIDQEVWSPIATMNVPFVIVNGERMSPREFMNRFHKEER